MMMLRLVCVASAAASADAMMSTIVASVTPSRTSPWTNPGSYVSKQIRKFRLRKQSDSQFKHHKSTFLKVGQELCESMGLEEKWSMASDIVNLSLPSAALNFKKTKKQDQAIEVASKIADFADKFYHIVNDEHLFLTHRRTDFDARETDLSKAAECAFSALEACKHALAFAFPFDTIDGSQMRNGGIVQKASVALQLIKNIQQTAAQEKLFEDAKFEERQKHLAEQYLKKSEFFLTIETVAKNLHNDPAQWCLYLAEQVKLLQPSDIPKDSLLFSMADALVAKLNVAALNTTPTGTTSKLGQKAQRFVRKMAQVLPETKPFVDTMVSNLLAGIEYLSEEQFKDGDATEGLLRAMRHVYDNLSRAMP